MEPTDIQEFIELGLPTCAFMHGRAHSDMSAMRRSFQKFAHEFVFDRDSQVFVLVSSAGEYAAQLWLHATVNRFSGVSELWVWDLTVSPKFRRRGIGRALLELAESEAQSRGLEELWLLVSSKNSEAVRLYQQRGLTPGGYLMFKHLQDSEPVRAQVTVKEAELRPLAPADIDSLYDLWRCASLPFRPNGRDEPSRLFQHLGRHEPGGFGLFRGSKIIAGMLISSDGRKGWVERIAVIPEERRTGIGRVLLATAMAEFKRRNLLVYAALIEGENQSSRRLFESCGWSFDPDVCYYSFREQSDF